VRQLELTVPSPAVPGRLDRFLCAQLHGLSRRRVKGIVDAGQVRVNGRPERKAGRGLRPGDVVDIAFRPSMLPCPELTSECVIADGDGWIAIRKPPGLPTHRPDPDVPGVPERLAAVLGVATNEVRPAHRLDRGTSGVLLVALDLETAGTLSGAFARREVDKEYRAVVSPAPDAEDGELTEVGEDGPMELRWSVRRRSRDGSRAELTVRPRQGRTHQIRRQLSSAGWPIVGDLEYGVALSGGAPRMGLHCVRLGFLEREATCEPPSGWGELLEAPRPSAGQEDRRGAQDQGARLQESARVQRRIEPEVGAPRERRTPRRGGTPRLKVSGATARVIAGGHPWVLPDRDTGDLGRFEVGDQALLVDPRGRELGVALIEPDAPVVARLLGRELRESLDADAFRARTERALAGRKRLTASGDTDCYRLVHGEADGLPGVTVDRWGDALVITRASLAARAFEEPMVDALTAAFPGSRVYRKDHLVDLRQRGRGREGEHLPGRWLVGGPRDEDGEFLVREAGLAYRVEPFGGLTTGLYPDQRRNRERLSSLVGPSARVANLFAHTAAFSVRLAAAGAARTVSVDLARPYCLWAEENLARNGLDPAAHQVVQAGSLEWLGDTSERFTGVVLDPPSHARSRGGGRGWNAKRDYASLVTAAAAVLEDGPGWLLCIINTKGVKPGWLRERVSDGLRAAGREPDGFESAPPSLDVPARKGFPEGRAFVGLLAHVAGR